MKLLQKTIRSYLLYSIFVLLVAIPAFYIVIDHILQHEVEEQLLSTKVYLKPDILHSLKDPGAGKIVFLDQHIKLQLSADTKQYDSLSTIELYDSTEKEIIPFRVIRSNFVMNGQPYFLYREISLIENDDLIKSILLVEVVLLVLLLGGLLIINRDLSIRVWRPFYKTLDQLQQYNVEKHPGLLLGKSSVAEFNDLNKSLQELTERAHKTFVSQKEFTENASHEMQTPLAILQSKLELLMQTVPLNGEQAGYMDALADASERMSRLNKSLLLLTKIENDQFRDIELVSLNKVIGLFTQQYAPQAEEKQLTVITQATGDLTIQANKMLIEILVGNLFGNAIRHNHEHGTVTIHIHTDSFSISNTGRKEALDPEQIFKRFRKESTNTNSIGLGLEIAKKICSLYGYAISYQHLHDQHQFIVTAR